MFRKIEYKPTKRDAFCRGCDKTIVRNTEKVFTTYSMRNRGQHIYICMDCINKFLKIVEEEK